MRMKTHDTNITVGTNKMHKKEKRKRKFNSFRMSIIFLFDFSDVDQIENGIGEKLALFFQYFTIFIAGYVVGFVYGWELTLVILAVSPLLIISGGIMSKVCIQGIVRIHFVTVRPVVRIVSSILVNVHCLSVYYYHYVQFEQLFIAKFDLRQIPGSQNRK